MLLRALFVLFTLTFLILSNGHVSQAQSDFRYAYVDETETGTVSVGWLNPDTNTYETVVTLPSEAGGLSVTAPSVGHEWMALVLRNNAGWQLALVNALTQEVRLVPVAGIGLYAPTALENDPQYLAWSPDGRYLAFTWGDNTNNTFGVYPYLYSVEDNALISLRQGDNKAGRLAWSNEGRHLAVGMFQCQPGGDSTSCTTSIELFDVTTQA